MFCNAYVLYETLPFTSDMAYTEFCVSDLVLHNKTLLANYLDTRPFVHSTLLGCLEHSHYYLLLFNQKCPDDPIALVVQHEVTTNAS